MTSIIGWGDMRFVQLRAGSERVEESVVVLGAFLDQGLERARLACGL